MSDAQWIRHTEYCDAQWELAVRAHFEATHEHRGDAHRIALADQRLELARTQYREAILSAFWAHVAPLRIVRSMYSDSLVAAVGQEDAMIAPGEMRTLVMRVLRERVPPNSRRGRLDDTELAVVDSICETLSMLINREISLIERAVREREYAASLRESPLDELMSLVEQRLEKCDTQLLELAMVRIAERVGDQEYARQNRERLMSATDEELSDRDRKAKLWLRAVDPQSRPSPTTILGVDPAFGPDSTVLVRMSTRQPIDPMSSIVDYGIPPRSALAVHEALAPAVPQGAVSPPRRQCELRTFGVRCTLTDGHPGDCDARAH